MSKLIPAGWKLAEHLTKEVFGEEQVYIEKLPPLPYGEPCWTPVVGEPIKPNEVWHNQ